MKPFNYQQFISFTLFFHLLHRVCNVVGVYQLTTNYFHKIYFIAKLMRLERIKLDKNWKGTVKFLEALSRGMRRD